MIMPLREREDAVVQLRVGRRVPRRVSAAEIVARLVGESPVLRGIVVVDAEGRVGISAFRTRQSSDTVYATVRARDQDRAEVSKKPIAQAPNKRVEQKAVEDGLIRAAFVQPYILRILKQR